MNTKRSVVEVLGERAAACRRLRESEILGRDITDMWRQCHEKDWFLADGFVVRVCRDDSGMFVAGRELVLSSCDVLATFEARDPEALLANEQSYSLVSFTASDVLLVGSK